MEIIISFEPLKELQEKLENQFPEISFTYSKFNELADEKIATAEVFVTFGNDVTEELVAKAKNLKWVMVMSAGVDELPFTTLKERHILVTNVRGIHSIPMAEFAFSFMLNHVKKLAAFAKQQEQKVWKRLVPLQELYGSTLLIVGAGAIGSQIGKYGKVFGMNVVGINSSGRQVEGFDGTYPISELKEHLPKADFVVSVLPSTELTNDVFAIDEFRAMKETAVFINLGRGNAVNEADLLKALEAGEFEHAYLDVFKQEPLPEDSPLWKNEKVTITPHLSAVTDQYQPRAFEIFIENLQKYVNGEKDYKNEIDLERGY